MSKYEERDFFRIAESLPRLMSISSNKSTRIGGRYLQLSTKSTRRIRSVDRLEKVVGRRKIKFGSGLSQTIYQSVLLEVRINLIFCVHHRMPLSIKDAWMKALMLSDMRDLCYCFLEQECVSIQFYILHLSVLKTHIYHYTSVHEHLLRKDNEAG